MAACFVVVALIIRMMMMTKYGRHNIGLLWLVLEPTILCSGVLVLRSFISGREENGIPLITMLAAGYPPFTFWRHLTNSGVMMLRRGGPMLHHRDISLFDVAIGTAPMEFGGCTVAALVVYRCLYTPGLMGHIHDIGLVLSGWFIIGFLSISVIMTFAVITELYEWIERSIHRTNI